MGADRPQGTRHLTPGNTGLPFPADLRVTLELGKAAHPQAVLFLEMALHRLGQGIALARQADHFHVEREVVCPRLADLEPPGKPLQLVHRQAGSDDGAVQLVLQIP